jgi:hypothetical protein
MMKKFGEGEFHQFVIEQFAALHSRITDVQKGVRDIRVILEPLSEAFDRDAEALVEHDRRLLRVEQKLDLGRSF